MNRYTKAVLVVVAILMLPGCQESKELFSGKAVYDSLCRKIIDDVSLYPSKIKIRETKIFIKPISDEEAKKDIDDDWLGFLEKYRKGSESFQAVTVGYKLLENDRSKSWICVFTGLPSTGMYVSSFVSGNSQFDYSDNGVVFKSGTLWLDVFRLVTESDFSWMEKTKFWFASLRD